MNKQQWIRTQPCAICCLKPPPSECSHVRTAKNSGTGIKPPDEYTIPACHNCHHVETVKGRSAALREIKGIILDKDDARDWYLAKAAFYEAEYKKTPLKKGAMFWEEY
jgi:hypothetical protein